MYKTLVREFRRRVSVMQDVPQECARVSHKAFRMECVLQECSTRVSYKTVSREFRRRVSVMQDVPQECARVSHKAFRMECVLQECPTRVSYKTVSREFRRRVSVMQDVPQECARVSHKAFRITLLRNVSRNSLVQTLVGIPVGPFIQECGTLLRTLVEHLA